MAKALIIYGSTTGNAEEMARMVTENLDKAGLETQIKDVADSTVENLTEDHDLVLLGCAAYGYDEIELQEDFSEFYDRMNGIELKGKKFAVFAPGDSSYEHFCGSVDKLEDKMAELGGTKVVDGLRIDGEPDDFKEEIEEWTQSVAKSA
jgi:flavodoxin short chain